ncbi:type II toxin-antitoxin system RelE/ParE family toxin [Methylorubrum suomiense]|uniref:Addiction module toxin RelE n=1 Tax=Methylorubrum suomiense TaxID=144191 RepID=A0ABQ4V2Q8_9HYPH|nr:type II toxin-antitoxin system RelE/ParE family toxin [Methylorubrum suomiense]GJE78575.1 hypothetical protein BGCPKDLD_5192 [Methylorubrum suomiense]
MHGIVQIPLYQADAKAAGVSPAEDDAIEAAIASNPLCGDPIEGTGGARKVRIGGKGKGKSGGYRVFFYPSAQDVPIFLLRLLSKGKRANLDKAERNAIKAYLSTIVDDYRESVRKAAARQRARTQGNP